MNHRFFFCWPAPLLFLLCLMTGCAHPLKPKPKLQPAVIDAVPRGLHIVMGGAFSVTYSVDVQRNGTLLYMARNPARPEEDRREVLAITPDQWIAFRRALDKAQVWQWSPIYADAGAMDGKVWTFEAEYEDHVLHTAGSHAFPKKSSFQGMLQAVRKLVGGRPFE